MKAAVIILAVAIYSGCLASFAFAVGAGWASYFGADKDCEG